MRCSRSHRFARNSVFAIVARLAHSWKHYRPRRFVVPLCAFGGEQIDDQVHAIRSFNVSIPNAGKRTQITKTVALPGLVRFPLFLFLDL